MSIFDNATNVVIGNKEVQSIIGPNGEVFYQKPVSHNYALTWSSASYTATGGSATISCTLTDNGSPVSGATVSVSGGGSVYSGLTNGNGVASVNVSYASTGTVTYTASYSNVSSSCTVIYPSVDITLSEPLDSILIHQVTNLDITSINFVPAQEVAEYFQDGPVTVNYLNNHQNQEIIDMIIEGAFTIDDVTNYTSDFFDMDIDLADYDLTNIPLFAPFDWDGNVHRVEYTATDSTHLTITITNDIISE